MFDTSLHRRLREDSVSRPQAITSSRSVERQRRAVLVVAHACEIVSGIDLPRSAEEELLEGLHRPGSQRMTDTAKGDSRTKWLRAGDGDEREVVREDPRPVGHEVIPREGDVSVSAGDHLRKIAMHDPEAAWETRHLRGEECVGPGCPEQRVGGGP